MREEPLMPGTSEGTEREQPSRRTVLHGAVAGLTLAAAGLFPPATVDEAAARQVAAEGKSRRKKRRARRRRKNKGGNDNPPGSGVEHTNVRLIAENLTAGPLYFRGWIVTDDRRCPTKELLTIEPNTAPTFAPGTPNANGLIYDEDDVQYTFGAYDQDPDDGFPFVELSHGGTLSKDHCRVDTTSDVVLREMGVGMSFEKTIQKFRFVVKRESDTEDERLFRFQIHPAP